MYLASRVDWSSRAWARLLTSAWYRSTSPLSGGRTVVSSFFGFDPTEAYYFVGKETVLPTDRPGMPIWGERLFALLHRNAGNPVKYFQLPPSRVMEVGTRMDTSKNHRNKRYLGNL